ncbi:DUF4377 domain-containing protein [Rhodanobacter sp. C03]|uniref:DUF4377 domain-containing protein n=1 Tax=Rhodanobacter sp. C03 TaxID=1945858 RepID=UPI0009843FD1|nr:DUF4377 domain-containing protein [Rhodanobacter sp. C03]OOG55455.1 hypothetical protein B0E48_12445 [Rhodanobacter sp. C03]
MKICLLLFPLALTACMAVPASTTRATTPTANSSNAQVSPDTLARYDWQLHDAVDSSGKRLDALFGLPDKPLQLDFAEGRIHVQNACNGIGGSYLIVDGHLQVAPMMHTMMACHDQTLMQRQSVITTVLRSKPMLTLSMTGNTPQLTLVADDGHLLTFSGVVTAETRYGNAGETVFLEVEPGTIPCQHPLIPNQTCLRVREIHYDAHGLRSGQPGPWQPLQQTIEGYVQQPDTRNVLRVKRYTMKQPPADAPSTAYVLDMVVETEMVKASNSNAGNVAPTHP